MFSAVVRERVIDALDGTPDLLAYVLGHLDKSASCWDVRNDPESYSLREILAHLADWDAIWYERMSMTKGGQEPILAAVNLYQRAQEMGYSETDPIESLQRLTQSRPVMVAFLSNLTPVEWKRVAFHPEEGRQSIETQAAWVLAHDDYYIKQVVRILKGKRAGK
jgi:uncharacterized damage-inducible protein DinB